MNVHQKKTRASKISKNTLKLRKQIWPGLKENDLWVRTRSKGFATLPRTMPIILRIMDDLSNGKPIAATYLSLWCRVFDESFVKIISPGEMAFESGFSGQRAVNSWESRMKILVELGFIKAKKGPSGLYNFVLLLNPYKVITKYNQEKKVQEEKYTSLFQRSQEIGANDLEDE